MPVNPISAAFKHQVDRVFATLPHVYGGGIFARASCASAIRFVAGRFDCSIEEAADYVLAGCNANFKSYGGKTCLFFGFHLYVDSDEHFSLVFSRETSKVTVEAHPLFAKKTFYLRGRLEAVAHNIASSVAFTRGRPTFPKTGFIIVSFSCGPVKIVRERVGSGHFSGRYWEAHLEQVSRFSTKQRARWAIQKYCNPGSGLHDIVEIR